MKRFNRSFSRLETSFFFLLTSRRDVYQNWKCVWAVKLQSWSQLEWVWRSYSCLELFWHVRWLPLFEERPFIENISILCGWLLYWSTLKISCSKKIHWFFRIKCIILYMYCINIAIWENNNFCSTQKSSVQLKTQFSPINLLNCEILNDLWHISVFNCYEEHILWNYTYQNKR